MPDILVRVSNFILQSGMPIAPSKVLVALSGGGDSVALLLILRELGYTVHAAHCNFGLRPEAAAEEAWLEAQCRRWEIPLSIMRFTAHDFAKFEGEGTQQAARKLRYTFFETQMVALGISTCATGHHADDQVESLVMSFFRGNSPDLFHPIPAQRGPYWRPLLEIEKPELMQWLIERGQTWCHDASNDRDDYQRNLVRNQLLPLLEQIQPAFRDRFRQQAARYAQQQAWMASQFAQLTPKIVRELEGSQHVQLDLCADLVGPPLVTLYIDWWLASQSFTGTQIAEVLRLLQADTGATIRCGEYDVLKDRHQLLIRPIALDADFESQLLQPEVERVGELTFGQAQIQYVILPAPIDFTTEADCQQQHWLDWERVVPPIHLRRWEQGDRMQPLGMKGSKLISDILIDQKRDRFAKSSAWVLLDSNGILLLDGFRIAAQPAITAQTKWGLRIQVRHSV